MAKTKKEVVKEVVDQIITEYAHYLYNPQDMEAILYLREFVKAQVELEYDRAMVIANIINNQPLSEVDKAWKFNELMNQKISALKSTIKQHQTEIREKTPKNWGDLEIYSENTSDEKKEINDEEFPDEMMEFVLSSSDSLDEEEEKKYYQSQSEIFNDLLSKIIKPLSTQKLCDSLLKNNPLAKPNTPAEASKKSRTTTIKDKRDKLIKEVVDRIIETHRESLAVDEAFARTYLTSLVSKQLHQVANSVNVKMLGQNPNDKDWINQTQQQIIDENSKIIMELSANIDRSESLHAVLDTQIAHADKHSGPMLKLEQQTTYLVDIIGPLAKLEVLSELNKFDISLAELTKGRTVIPNYPPPKPPATVKKQPHQAYTQAQSTVKKVMSANKSTADPGEVKPSKK